MAPVYDYYAVASGQDIHGGHSVYAFVRPLWRQAMAGNTWIEIPTANVLNDLNPQLNPALNPNYPSRPEWLKSPATFGGIVSAWCGGCLDRDTDTMWHPFGSGHADGAGGEPYKVRLDVDAPEYVMVRPPSGAIGNVINTDDRPTTRSGSTSTDIILASMGNGATQIYGGYDAASTTNGAYVGMTLVIGGQSRTISAYNGATFTATVGSAFSVSTENQNYTITSGGTAVLGVLGELTGRYADGRPRATHTYNKPVYIPGVGPALAVQGATSWTGGNGTTRPIILDPVTGEMTRFGASNTNWFASKGAACWDESRGVIWAHHSNSGRLAAYHYATDSWTYPGSAPAFSGEIGMCYMPDDDCLLLTSGGGFANKLAVFDCATSTRYLPSVTGSLVGMTDPGKCQPQWVPSLNAAAVWDNSTSTTVINLLNKPANPRTGTWTITQLPVAAENTVTPTAKSANGTFGRFAYSSRLNGFFLLNAVTQRPYFFALD